METPKLLIAVGIGLVLLGVLAGFAQRIPALYSWFGHLPGDIRYESEHTFVFIPLTSMLLLGVGCSVVVRVARWLFER